MSVEKSCNDDSFVLNVLNILKLWPRHKVLMCFCLYSSVLKFSHYL